MTGCGYCGGLAVLGVSAMVQFHDGMADGNGCSGGVVHSCHLAAAV